MWYPTQRYTEKLFRRLLGENNIDVMLQNLDRLTLDEVRATSAQTLHVVTNLVQHRVLGTAVDGEDVVPGLFLVHF